MGKSETKHEKFQRLRDSRLPKAIHAIELLGNLGSSGYESSLGERQAIVAALQKAVDAVAATFEIPAKPTTPEPAPKPELQPQDEEDVRPTDIADGGSLAKYEILWAFDAVQRKDWKLAANRLKRVIDMWKDQC